MKLSKKHVFVIIALLLLTVSIGLYTIQAASRSDFCNNYCIEYMLPTDSDSFAAALYFACMDGCMNG